MLASKVVCDDTYSNKSWAVVGQGMFALREINQMEREMCGYLEWQLNVPREDLEGFEAEVRRVFGIARGAGYGQGVQMLLNSGVGGKPFPSSAPTISPPPVPSSVQIAPPPVPEKAVSPISVHANNASSNSTTSPQQLPTPTEGGVTQMPSFARNGAKGGVVVMPVPQIPVPQQQQQQQRAMPYPSPPTTPPSPAISASTRSLASRGSQNTMRQGPYAVPPQQQMQMQIPQYIIPASKHGSAASDSDSDDSECSSDEDEDEQREGEGEDAAHRLTDSPSPTPSSSTSASTASDGSLRTPPSAKAPQYSTYSVASSHHAHSGSYGGLVKSFSLPPGVHAHSGNNVQRSQTMSSSEFVVSVPHPSRAGGANFLGGWPNSNNGGNAMNVDNGSDAEYVGVVSVANGNNGGKKMQALMMPRTYTVPCAW